MSELPLNSLENTPEKLSHGISNISKSPYKLSMTEKRVIGGLQKLTDLLFKQFYNIQIDDHSNKSAEQLQSDEVTTSTEYAVSSTSEMYADKENAGNNQQVPKHDTEAEQFCAMVVRQLTGENTVKPEEWHRDQLDAYNLAHKRFFG